MSDLSINGEVGAMSDAALNRGSSGMTKFTKEARDMSGIEERAAAYFGATRDASATLKTSRYRVLVVRPNGRAFTLGIYSEESTRPSGELVYLDCAMADHLRNALR